MAKKMSAKQAESVECELIEWLISRCPVRLPERTYRNVAKQFMAGHLIVVCSRPVNPTTAKVDIWAG